MKAFTLPNYFLNLAVGISTLFEKLSTKDVHP